MSEENKRPVTLKELIELYDNWNGRTKINCVDENNNWQVLYEGDTWALSPFYNGLGDREVIAFGMTFNSTLLTVRIK